MIVHLLLFSMEFHGLFRGTAPWNFMDFHGGQWGSTLEVHRMRITSFAVSCCGESVRTTGFSVEITMEFHGNFRGIFRGIP